MAFICFALAAVLFAAVLWPWPSLEIDRGDPVSSADHAGKRSDMPTKPHITVEPRPDGRWAVQKDGTQRASKLFDRQADAEARAREQAKRENAELVVKGRDGRIQRRDSHGADDLRKTG